MLFFDLITKHTPAPPENVHRLMEYLLILRCLSTVGIPTNTGGNPGGMWGGAGEWELRPNGRSNDLIRGRRRPMRALIFSNGTRDRRGGIGRWRDGLLENPSGKSPGFHGSGGHLTSYDFTCTDGL